MKSLFKKHRSSLQIFLLFICLLLANNGLSQTSTPVQVPSVKYEGADGIASKAKVLKQSKLVYESSVDSSALYEVISFDIFILIPKADGIAMSFKGNTLTEDFFKIIREKPSNTKIFFENIIVRTPESVLLAMPPFSIKMID